VRLACCAPILGKPRVESPSSLYWGPGFANEEIGALRNRCLIATPWAAYVNEDLNYSKQRESYRPFAIAVPAEDAATYFEYTPHARFYDLTRQDPASWPRASAGLLVTGRSCATLLVNTSFNLANLL
jgi:predicted NodU family carbamoyl transferase